MSTITPKPGTSRVSITVALSTLMVTVAVVLAGFLVYFNYQRNHEAALLAAQEMLAAVSGQVEDRVLALIRPVVRIAELAPDIAPIGMDDDGIKPAYRAFLTHLVEQADQVSSVFIGLSDGSFFQVAALDAYSSGVREKLGVPSSAVVAQYTIAAGRPGELLRKVEYFAEDGSPTSDARNETTGFDPRQRPWYQRAMEAKGVVATPPYRFASSGDLGITVARRLPGARKGVLGVDITLAGLTRFLENQRPTPDSRLYLAEPAGHVLAWAGAVGASAFRAEAKLAADALPDLSDFADPFAAMLRTSLQDGTELPAQIEQQGRIFITQVRPMVGPLGATFHIGIIVPADHFTGAIIALGRHSAYISILFILATVPLIALASRAFSRPLHKLAEEADAIRAFKLEQPVEVSSRVREIQALSTSMDRMKSGLRTFGVYVPRDLVRQMMSRSTPPKLGGERREITVLFTDIAGFTPIADGLEPEVVMQRMSTYFETATVALREHGGTIDKFMGDAVMAIWNALVDDAEHAVSGCCGVLAMRAALAALNTRLLAQGLAPMPTRFGLHTGDAVVGNVGSSERMNFTALGATVNLAARLEPLNKVFGTEILISEQVAERVRDHFHIRSVAIVKPKGVGQPLRVCELLAERGTGGDFDWIAQWESAFEAFIGGDFDTSARLVGELPASLAADPVRNYLLERIARDGQRTKGWDPVEAF